MGLDICNVCRLFISDGDGSCGCPVEVPTTDQLVRQAEVVVGKLFSGQAHRWPDGADTTGEYDKQQPLFAPPVAAPIDLVVHKDNGGTYHATGGPGEALFGGTGKTSDEAIGAWFRQNREVAGFQVSFVMDGKFSSSTRYGAGRSRDELGPNELKALLEHEGETDGTRMP